MYKMTIHLPQEYIQNLDNNLKLLTKEIRRRLNKEYDVVIGITGYPGTGKSTLAIILSALTDPKYSLSKNICFIPTSSQIENTYKSLPQKSVLHIDEASRGLHKHKWQDRIQQKLNELYDTERENHFLCTLLIMPRFQNFSENFRNFRINIWINIIERGIAIAYKKDEDKDCKDPWHIDENYKNKLKKYWKKKKIYERTPYEIVQVESKTSNYWFYFTFPDLPKNIRDEYRNLKADSRITAEPDLEVETYKEKLDRQRKEKWKKIIELKNKGFTNEEVGIQLGVTGRTIVNYLKDIRAWRKIEGGEGEKKKELTIKNNYQRVRKNEIPKEFDKITQK